MQESLTSVNPVSMPKPLKSWFQRYVMASVPLALVMRSILTSGDLLLLLQKGERNITLLSHQNSPFMIQLHRMALLNDKIALLLSKFMPYCMQVVSLDSSGVRPLVTSSA